MFELKGEIFLLHVHVSLTNITTCASLLDTFGGFRGSEFFIAALPPHMSVKKRKAGAEMLRLTDLKPIVPYSLINRKNICGLAVRSLVYGLVEPVTSTYGPSTLGELCRV